MVYIEAECIWKAMWSFTAWNAGFGWEVDPAKPPQTSSAVIFGLSVAFLRVSVDLRM